MICTGENKAVLCKGDFHPAQLYKGDKKIAGYTIEEFNAEGNVTLENCYNDKLHNTQIIGNTIQDGTPTPEAPIEIQSVGELVTEGEYAGKYKIPVRARGKNYFDIDKVPFSNFTTQPYNRGLKATKTSGANRGNKIPISLPIGKTIYMTLDVVDSKIDGTSKYISLSFLNSSNSSIFTKRITSTIARKSFSFTLSEEMSYMQFFFQAADVGNAVGDFMIMDNIMIRCEGDDAYEPYIEPQMVNIYLDEPLRNVGNYADYIDSERRKVIRNIKQETITEITGVSADGGEYKKFTCKISEEPLLFSSVPRNETTGTVISNKFKSTDKMYKDLGDGGGLIMPYITTSKINTVAMTFNATSIKTLEAAQAAIGDGFEVCYILEEPIEEAIEFPELPTFKGTTVIEIDSDITATISGKYKRME